MMSFPLIVKPGLDVSLKLKRVSEFSVEEAEPFYILHTADLEYIQNIKVRDYLDPDDENLQFEPGTLYIYRHCEREVSQPITWYDFGKGFEMRDTAAAYILWSGMQEKKAIRLYDVATNSLIELPIVDLPLVLVEELELGTFFGSASPLPGMFEVLGLTSGEDTEFTEDGGVIVFNLESFFGRAPVSDSLFEFVGLSEVLTASDGGTQIYP